MCGLGLLAEQLSAAGAHVTAIDSSPYALLYARSWAASRGFDIEYRLQDFLQVHDFARLTSSCSRTVCSPQIRTMGPLPRRLMTR